MLRSDYVNADDEHNEQLRSPKIDKPNVLVYPNPSSDKFFIAYNLGDNSNALLQVFDINGRFVTSQVLATNRDIYTLETNNMENGVYLYTVTAANGIIASGKLVLIK
jgi:Secretion system C-terminal sorting domain